MILVLLGTNDKKFTRLLDAIERQISLGNIKEKVIVQAGCTDYKSDNMEIFDLIDKEKLDKLIMDASLIITHAGVGSILSGIENNKKVIAAARLSKYNEHTNDHQIEILEEFTKLGYILKLDNFDDLGKVIEKSKTFKPNKYKSNNKEFVKLVNNYITETNNISWHNKYRFLKQNGLMGIILLIINILIFNKLSYSLLINISLSYLITILIELIYDRIVNIRINNMYIITKIYNFILDILLMNLFINILSINTSLSKVITNIIIFIITFIILKVKKYENSNNNTKL